MKNELDFANVSHPPAFPTVPGRFIVSYLLTTSKKRWKVEFEGNKVGNVHVYVSKIERTTVSDLDYLFYLEVIYYLSKHYAKD